MPTPRNRPVVCGSHVSFSCVFDLGQSCRNEVSSSLGSSEVWQRSKQKPLEIRHLGTASEQLRLQCYVASGRVEGTCAHDPGCFEGSWKFRAKWNIFTSLWDMAVY